MTFFSAGNKTPERQLNIQACRIILHVEIYRFRVTRCCIVGLLRPIFLNFCFQIKITRPIRVNPKAECSDEESQLRVPTNSRIVSSVDSSSIENTGHVLLPSSHFISSIKFAQQQRLLDYSSTSSDVSLA